MRIAVCLSGQPRTFQYCAENIKQFFSGDYQVDFFGHSWNTDSYKISSNLRDTIHQPADFSNLKSAIDLMDFKEFKIGVLDPKKSYVESLFYSAYICNHLKKQYEQKNNFKYDIVFKTRFDVIFKPGVVFKPSFLMTQLKGLHNYTAQLDLFTGNMERFAMEYSRINISDIWYYGHSWAMDAISDIYWFIKNIPYAVDDINNFGPGVYLDEFSSKFNLRFYADNQVSTIYRLNAVPLNPLTDYDTINEHNMKIYL